jgi:hypothetical protein
MRIGRSGHTATLLATGQVLLAGGFYDAAADDWYHSTTACDLYDFTTHQLATQPPPDMHQARAKAAASPLNGSQAVLVAGGAFIDAQDNSVDPPTSEIYLVATNQWVNAPDSPVPHLNAAIVSLSDNAVMLIGGLDFSGFQNRADIFTFSPTPPYGVWTNAGNFATFGRATAPAALLSNGAVLLASGWTGTKPYGNGWDPGVYSAEADLYDPTTGKWIQTTPQPIAHRVSTAQSVSYQGTVRTIVFGEVVGPNGAPTGGNDTITNESEVFNLNNLNNPNDPCTSNVECAVGTCTGGICVPPGFPITLDATALSHKGLLIRGSAYPKPLDTTQARQVSLLPGTYTLEVYAGLASVATFTVNADGTITYDSSLEGVLSGNNSKTLKVNGRTITVDARRLSEAQLQLLAYHFNLGNEVDNLPFNTNALQTFTLLPVPTFGYQFDVGSLPANFSFNIDIAGNVHIPPSDANLASGEGTPTLTIGGAHVSVTVPTGLGAVTVADTITLTEGQQTDLYLLPYSGGSPIDLKIGNQTTTFNLDTAGRVSGDPQLLRMLQLSGTAPTGGQSCSVENALAELNGWTLTSLSCQGVAQPDGTNAIDAPSAVLAPSTRLRGPGRTLNELPRLRKAAGGDPVLGDGEFTIQRVDASYAGFGLHYEFRRTYRSGMEMDTPLSPGWDHNFDQRLIGTPIFDPLAPNFDPTTAGDIIDANCDGTIQFQDGQGNLELFTSTGWTTDGDGNPLHKFSSKTPDVTLEFHYIASDPGFSFWRLTYANGIVEKFDRAGFLKSITDLATNSLTFAWERATPLPPPNSNCASTGYTAPGCAHWFLTLTQLPIGQRRRLHLVTDPAQRKIYYNYAQQDPTGISTTDRLSCISDTFAGCDDAFARVQFAYTDNRLTDVRYGIAGGAPVESYAYHAPASDLTGCIASADLPNYCNRLCNDPSDGTNCTNLGYDSSVRSRCGLLYCTTDANECAQLQDTFPLRKGASLSSPSVCCTANNGGGGDHSVCTNFLWGGATCIDGCEQSNQCERVINGTTYAVYAAGVMAELNNDITDVKDSKGQLVVHNVYGEDPTWVSFDKVTSQQINSASSDNTITFEYHDLQMEADLQLPIYTSPSGPPKYLGEFFSIADPNVTKFKLAPKQTMAICPRFCPGGGSSCPVVDYGPAFVDGITNNPSAMTAAVVIHDLHGLTRIQYLDATADAIREVTVETNEVADYNYRNGLLAGTLSASGVRTCLERDNNGRVTQSTLLPAPGYSGSATTQATTMAYSSAGQVTDVVRDALGTTPIKTHYERDYLSRVIRMDQDVKTGGTPLPTTYHYDGETPQSGVLESPTEIDYPNKRVDKFSQFDFSMGGPKSIVIDSGDATPEQRYVSYDYFGRVIEEGEANRFAHQYQFNDATDIWRLTNVLHRQDINSPWINIGVQSHRVDGELVVDSNTEPTRTTTFTNVALSDTGGFGRDGTATRHIAPCSADQLLQLCAGWTPGRDDPPRGQWRHVYIRIRQERDNRRGNERLRC